MPDGTPLVWMDPELQPIIAQIPEFDLDGESLDEARRRLTASRPVQPDGRAVEVRCLVATANGLQVDVLVYTPTSADVGRAAVLQIHGGGLVMGSASVMDAQNRALADELGCTVIGIDYRLAPEHPFPAALDDCYAVLAWVNENSDALGIDPAHVAVKGESAGGGLAASLCQLALDRGEYKIVFQHLTYPMLDDRTCSRTDLPAWAGSVVWTNTANIFGWHSYLGGPPGVGVPPAYAVAARRPDLTALPPAYVVVGALDLFLEESTDYAMRLARHGVPVELLVVPGAFHSFLSFGAGTEIGTRVAVHSTDALRRGMAEHTKESQ